MATENPIDVLRESLNDLYHYTSEALPGKGRSEILVDAKDALAQVETLVEAVGDALNSIHTGPLREGYAYTRLDEALAPFVGRDGQ